MNFSNAKHGHVGKKHVTELGRAERISLDMHLRIIKLQSSIKNIMKSV